MSVFLSTYCMVVGDYRIRDPAVTVIGRLRFLLLEKRNKLLVFINDSDSVRDRVTKGTN